MPRASLARCYAVSLALAAACVGAAPAAGSDAGEPRASCAPEIRSLCADRAADDDVLDCLMDHRGALSERCAGGIAARTVRTWAWRRRCQSEAQRFCADASPREEDQLACLGEHRAKLSADCTSRLDLMTEWSARMRDGAARFKRRTGSAPP